MTGRSGRMHGARTVRAPAINESTNKSIVYPDTKRPLAHIEAKGLLVPDSASRASLGTSVIIQHESGLLAKLHFTLPRSAASVGEPLHFAI